MSSALIFQIQSFLIMSLLITGVYFRRQRLIHVKFMSSAMIWDLLLILQIELTRNAIEKASAALSNPMILNIHVSLAVLSVIGYCIMTYSGLKLWKNQQAFRPVHRWVGRLTLVFRIMTFITSFFAVT